MLRHIISFSLAMTACASLISTKVNAAGVTLTPVGTLQRNPDDSIEFVLLLNPNSPPSSENEVEIQGFSWQGYDPGELALYQDLRLVSPGTRLTTTTTLARFIFKVLQPVRDGNNDVYAIVNYREGGNNFTNQTAMGGDVQPVPEQGVPEPLTMLGAATALGYGAILKRKSSKKTVS